MKFAGPLLLACAAAAQVAPEERALLDSRDSRRDFRCQMKRSSPSLGFDLRYHVRWQTTVRVADLHPAGDRLRVVVRVTPRAEGGAPLYLSDSYSVPSREKMRGNSILTYGGFSLGAGRYRVDWLLLTSRNRACSLHWDVRVKPRDDYRLAIAPNTAQPMWTSRSGRRASTEPLPAPLGRTFTIKILANFSNTNPRRSTLNSQDTLAVASILRTIEREPRFSRFTLVAFNMQEERVIFQAQDTARLDFPGLYRAISGLRLGVIDYQRLLDKHSATRFVTGLLTNHLDGQEPAPDAVLLVGPKLFLDRNVPREAIEAIAGSGAPVFYLNYVSNPRAYPWRDALASAVRTYGGKEFRITYPKDLSEALGEILRHLDSRTGVLAGQGQAGMPVPR